MVFIIVRIRPVSKKNTDKYLNVMICTELYCKSTDEFF